MKFQKVIAIFLLLLGFSALWFLRDSSALLRLIAASIGLLWVIKVAAVLWQLADGHKFESKLGLFLFFLWPGISIAGFTERNPGLPAATGKHFLESWLLFLLGTCLLFAISLIGKGDSTPLNYMALLSLLFILHLGLVEVAADLIRLLGFSPASLFTRPFLATSLRDFWSLRWNRAFVDMNRIFLLNPLRNFFSQPRLVFTAFIISGCLHELGISYADGKSWGKPLLYFLLQGLGMQTEKKWKFPLALVWAWILLPFPLLFTPAFTNLFLGGLAKTIAAFAYGLDRERIFGCGLVLGAISHLFVLCASVQVPGKLGWSEDFQKLRPLNRKVFWTYGAYIFAIIACMAFVSLVIGHLGLATASAASFLWLTFIAIFWWARVLVDCFFMQHSDWPQGRFLPWAILASPLYLFRWRYCIQGSPI